jgi:5-amino-6-(5-phosphoribosylamino)uracil reductase
VEIIAHLAVSLDGQTEAAGPPAMFGGAADRARMVARRASAGAVLVGGRTFSTWPIPPELRRDWAPEAPLRPTPPTYVVTKQDRLELRPVRRGFVGADASVTFFAPDGFVVPDGLGSIAQVQRSAADPLEAALRAAEAAGCARLLVEGGWGLIRALIARGALDALHLSLCPLWLGGAAATRVPPRGPLVEMDALRLRLVRAEAEGGAVFLHFVPERGGASATLA